jgi:hypothetical protein
MGVFTMDTAQKNKDNALIDDFAKFLTILTSRYYMHPLSAVKRFLPPDGREPAS